ncbi:metallophosphoesterase [Paramagnetospirillum marisnigri]|uniref:metallophosphoesterase n=1 Tax=Paramagnetospirillum marisnigri TaxID=1285242 RepID=UPI0009EDF6CA|nr:metallophosphoesterase [Paramagnetospirillum marisnigri]
MNWPEPGGGSKACRKWSDKVDGIYAIGDIHGCSAQLDALLQQILMHAASAGIDHPKVVCLGDYIDRGPDSKGVLDILTGPKMAMFDPVFLLGNHDLVLVGVCEGGIPSWDWVSEHGGQKCMDRH